jgi:light-regulated signal transduction histidine kinase (bacteriophytochrome)
MKLIHPDDKDRVSTAVQKAVDENGSFSTEFRMRTRDGDWRWILSRGKVAEVDAAGTAIRVTGYHTDITARKTAEAEIRSLNEQLESRVAERTAQLESANKELEAFAYTVSHDLRAPLRAIEGFSTILQEDHASSLDPNGQRACSIISQQTERMSMLIDDLLTFSRLGRDAMHRSPIDMSSLVSAVFQELTVHGQRERIDCEIGPLPSAVGDPALLRQVWTNLLSNAIKFSAKRDRARIVVRGGIEHNELHYVVIDNGEGFDMRYAERLFGVFQRLHSERDFEGTGVGLAIVQRILHRHGGRIWAESRPGEGATFHFTLPLPA